MIHLQILVVHQGFTKNLDTFCSDKMKKDLEFTPWGNKLFEYTRNANSEQSTFEIYKMDSGCSDYDNENFITYMDRVQTMLVYYIETSCFLDPDDPNWVHYFLYEKRRNTAQIPGKQSNEFRYITIGYLSVYRYYAYPDKTRSRISQIMIFPKYQNAGHGAELTECVIKDVYQNPDVIDVTAESPSPDFVRLRDYVTTKLCCTLPIFKDKEALRKGFNAEMVKQAVKHFKIPKLQSRRCYEILRMACTNQHSIDEWRNYRLDVKKRFYKPFLNRSKYARNAGGSLPDENQEEPETKSGSSSTLSKAFEGRFGGSSSKFDGIEEEESESGVTQIGFGGKSASKLNTKPVKMVSFGSRMGGDSESGTTQIGFGSKSNVESTTQIGFGNSNSSKSVSFAPKVTSLNTSDGTTDPENDEDENNSSKPENLFMNDKDRKKYLETEFQNTVDEYTKIIKRLEQADAL